MMSGEAAANRVGREASPPFAAANSEGIRGLCAGDPCLGQAVYSLL